nr:hypothetical protein [Tanacetum cinerariifolium]
TPFIVQGVIVHDVTFTVTARIKGGTLVQSSGSGITFLLAEAFFFRQRHSSSGSGKFLLAVGTF